MQLERTSELVVMLKEIGQYADGKAVVDIWHDHNNDEWRRVTILTTPPQVVCLMKWDGPKWRADIYRPGKWEAWLRAILIELRTERQRKRLATQVRAEQDQAKLFSPINDDELFT